MWAARPGRCPTWCLGGTDALLLASAAIYECLTGVLPQRSTLRCGSRGIRSMSSNAEEETASTWRQLVDGAIDTAIVSTDLDGRVRTWSAGAHRILGWTESEMRGQDLSRLFTEEDLRAGRLEREMEDARAKGRGGGEEGWRLRKGGSRFWAVGEMTPVRQENGQLLGFVKILRDRTQQRQAEDDLREERAALAIINRAASALARESELQRLVQIVTDAGVELSGAQFGAFFYNVTNAAGERYMLYTLSGASTETFASFPMPRNTAVFAPTFSGQGVVRSDDITADPRYGRNSPLRGMPDGHLPVRSYLAVPVLSREGTVLGGLFFGHATPAVFTERSEHRLLALAAEAAVAIDNPRLTHERQQELLERRRAEDALRQLNATLEEQVASAPSNSHATPRRPPVAKDGGDRSAHRWSRA